MKIHTITKIRNEIDIIGPFIRHLDSLFDKVYLLDHKSKDGTTEFLKQVVAQRPDWEYIFLDFNGHFHKEVSNFFIRKSFAEEADFLFFLDADEFLFVKNRKDLERRLSELDDFLGVGKFHFRAVLPVDYTATRFSIDTEFWLPPHRSPTQKIVVPKKCYEQSGRAISVTQGNHEALDADGYPVKTIDLGDILHVSVRSLDQLEKKFIIKSIAYLAIEHRNPAEGVHNFKRLEAIAQNRDVSTLINVEGGPPLPQSDIEFFNKGYRQVNLRTLKIPLSNDIAILPQISQSTLATLVADALLNFENESLQHAELVESNGVMKIRAIDSKPANSRKKQPSRKFNELNKFIPSKWREGIYEKRIRSAILGSGLFDPLWYRDAYMKTQDINLEPLDHFLQNGTTKRFNPGPSFDVGLYLDEYPDVRKSGLNPLVHYLLHGKIEKRTIFQVFDPAKIENAEKIDGINYLPNLESRVVEVNKDIRLTSIDLLVYIHGKLENITRCLDSILPTLRSGDKLWLINDSSEQENRQYLEKIQASRADQINLLDTPQKLFASGAINIGLSNSTAEYIIFVDSDAIVEQNWISKLLILASFDATIGIVSPLLSPLYNFSTSGKKEYLEQFTDSANDSFDEHTIEAIREYCKTLSSEHGHAIVPFIEGFCFLIKKELIKMNGMFDELSFELGIGDTADYCFRAGDAGYKCVISTDTFIFRQQKFTFPMEIQQQIINESNAYLKHKYSHKRVITAQTEVRSNAVLNNLHKELLRRFGLRIFIE